MSMPSSSIEDKSTSGIVDDQFEEPAESLNEGGSTSQAVHAQITDERGHFIEVSYADLNAAGIDITSISELRDNQVNRIVEIATPSRSDMTTNKRSHVISVNSDQNNGPNDTSSVTMYVTDTGSIKLTDLNGRSFHFSRDQLAAHNIDIHNLSDDNLTQIIALALPSGADIDKSQAKRCKLTEDETTEDHNRSFINVASHIRNPTQSKDSIFATGHHQQNFCPVIIGEHVDVRREGKSVPATIRYARMGTGYKVQFEDGHFEWVDEDQISVRYPRRGDHESYSGANSKRLSVGMAGTPQFPAKVHSSMAQMEDNAPNFCCAICARKVFQKEPSYIVIRLPSCDSCTREKVVILDDDIDKTCGN